MQQLLSVWSALDMRRRAVVIGATAAVFLAVLGLSRIATSPGMELLYSGLDLSASGEVVQALEQRSVAYEIRGGSIYVDSARRDELRMTLASEGLPSNNAQGYELLDSLSGFGTTSQMFDAAYWRAKEGELARTILSSPQIKGARVHIAQATSNGLRQKSNPSASVTVLPSGGALSGPHAKALRYLVASAVAGLAPDDVSVIDGRNGVVISADDTSVPQGGRSDLAAELKQNVERLLEARVGYGNSVVEVSVETVSESESIVERVIDPASRVAISSETEERETSSSEARSDAVTVASNLPTGDATGADGGSKSQNTETRERTNFEVSETKREILRVPGSLKRLSVAVLIDGEMVTAEDGASQWQPRADAELQALRELIASAVGLDETRGDSITVKSMQFEPLVAAGTEAPEGFLSLSQANAMTLVQLGVLAAVAIILGLFVIRPIFASRTSANLPALAPPSGRTALSAEREALTGEIDDRKFPPPSLSSVNALDDEYDAQPDPVQRLRNLIDVRRDETVQILRSWMEEDSKESV